MATLDKSLTLILDTMLEYIPYYGEFDLFAVLRTIKREKLETLQNHYSNPDQIITIKEFLINYGYAIKRNDIPPSDTHIELTERGRWLKQCGSMESYRQYQDQKKELKRLSDLETSQRNKRDKKQFYVNVLLCVWTGIAAVYYLLEILDHFFHFYPYPSR